LICSLNFLICLAVCFNISTVINIKILTNSNQQSYKFISHIAAFLSVVLITEMLEICIQTSYDQNVQLILKSYLHVVYSTPLSGQNGCVRIVLKFSGHLSEIKKHLLIQNLWYFFLYEKFEDTIGVIKWRKSKKDSEHNGHKKERQ
jgi:hypothetical protein